jgi:hypothetical protein
MSDISAMRRCPAPPAAARSKSAAQIFPAAVPRIAGFFEFAPVSASVSAGQEGGFDLLSLHPKIPFPAAGFSTARSRSMSQTAQTARHLEFLASGSERDRAWTGTLSPEKNYWL